jgi:competence protein ComEC
MTAPLVPLGAAFTGGIALGLWLAPPSWLPPAGLALAGLALWAAWRARLTAASAAILLLVGLAGWARTGLPDPWPAHEGLDVGVSRLEGLVTGDVEREGPRTEVPLLVDRVITDEGSRPARGRLRALLFGPPSPLQPGDRVRVTLDLRPARSFRNPGADGAGSARPGRPSLIATGRTETIDRRPPGGMPWWLRTRLAIHRVVVRELPAVPAALLEGLLIGERRRLPAGLLADFRAAGVVHVLAISGFNVALVAGAVVVTLRLLRVPARPAAALACLTLLGFAAVVGPEPSVLRATVMGVLAASAELVGREARTWNGLAAALIVLLAAEPGSLTDPGLQLSFAATAGILHLARPLALRLRPTLGHGLGMAIAVSVAAELAVAPLVALHFGQLSLVGPLANLAVVPLAAGATMLGLLALGVTAVAGWAGHLLFQTLWALLVGLRLLVRGLAALPGAWIPIPPPPAWSVAAGGLALLLLPLAGARRAHRVAVAALGLAAALGPAALLRPDGQLRVLMLDVGQGEAILVRGPDGAAVLVDAAGGGAGRSDRGERVVVPALRRAGVLRLAAVALTHGDPDHAGGLLGVLAGVPVGEVWLPAGSAAAGWDDVLAGLGVPTRPLARGDRLTLGPLLITALHPPRPAPGHPAPPATDPNNGSLVLRVEWGLATVLLMGDAERPVERALLDAGLPLRSLVLKVGHHGSRHATGGPFVEAVGPRLALISAGAGNPFGHPAPEVLWRLAGAGVEAARTDRDGAVEVWSDGSRLSWRRWATPSRVEAYALDGAP